MNKRKIINYLLSFIIPILLFLLVMYLRVGVIDGNYILISDMEAQYNSLFQYLKNVLNGTESLFYSFNKGLGGEMFTTFTYYLSSPLNMLVFFFEDGQIPNCILLIILIKLGLSGLNMNIYLTHKNPDKLGINIIFSLCYALMSYTINYYFNIMWLDAVYMLPLITLGLEKLIDKNKPLLYISTLSYTIIANYYIGYMVCLFLLLYFIYQMILQNKKDKRTIVIFVLSSLLSAGISSFILIPTLIEIPEFASTQGNLSIKLDYIIEIFKGLLQNVIIGNHSCSDVSNQYGTYLYITNFCIVLILLYISNKTISSKTKILLMLLTILFILSFFLLPLTYVWHGFSIPSYLNNRNSFLLCFLLILCAFDSYVKRTNLKKTDIILIVVFYTGISFVIILLFGINIVHKIIITWLFVIIYIYLIYVIKKYSNNIYKIVLFFIILIEMFINLYFCFASKTVVSYSYDAYLNNICTALKNNVSGFRAENILGKNGIDGITCGYMSTTTFLSTLTRDDLSFFSKLGYLGSGKVQYNGTNNTLLMDSLLGIRKYYLSDDSTKTKTLNKIGNCEMVGIYNSETDRVEEEEFCIYENVDSLPIAYFVNSADLNLGNNVFENQNNILKELTGINKEFLYPAEYESNDFEYKIKNNNSPIYLYIDSKKIDRKNKIEIYVNGLQTFIDKDSLLLTNNILEIASDNAITDLEIVLDNKNIIDDITIYQIDLHIKNEFLDKLKENDIFIESITNSSINLTTDLDVEKNLIVTIPYDSNIDIYIDDEKTEKTSAFNYLINVKVPRGSHKIKLIYNNKIYIVSMIFSLIFVLLTIIFVKKCKKLHKNLKKI